MLPEGAYAFFRSDSFAAAVRFIDAISGLVGEGDRPDIDIRHDGVTVLLRAFKGTGQARDRPTRWPHRAGDRRPATRIPSGSMGSRSIGFGSIVGR